MKYLELYMLLAALIVVLVGELVAHFAVFNWLNNKFGVDSNRQNLAQMKGHLERILLFISFAAQVPQVVIAFAALKLGLWFQPENMADNDKRISRDYFLLGNLISILLALIYYLVWPLIVNQFL